MKAFHQPYSKLMGYVVQSLFCQAKRLGITTSELGQCITNNMNCRPTAMSSTGEVTAVTCSYVMNGKMNVPFPQIDPGYSGEQAIICN